MNTENPRSIDYREVNLWINKTLVRDAFYKALYNTVKCPVVECRMIRGVNHPELPEKFDVKSLVVHLNDIHKWTYLEIADLIDKEFGDVVIGDSKVFR